MLCPEHARLQPKQLTLDALGPRGRSETPNKNPVPLKPHAMPNGIWLGLLITTLIAATEAADAAGLNVARGLRWFGFYSANLAVNAPYSNLFQADSVADAWAAHAVGQTSLLLTYDIFFTTVPGRMVLRPDWQARWAAQVTQVTPLLHSGVISGFNLGDELVWNCLDPTNLTIVANAVRASFPTAIVWYNEATPPLASNVDSCGHKNINYTIPEALDVFSTDIYHTDGAVAGWVESHVKTFYETYIFPRLGASQSVMLVPGSFGSDVNHYPNGTYVCDRQCYDQMCALDANDFYTWAEQDERIVAIMPWNWAGCPSCNGSRWTPPNECCMDELGTEVQPLATAAWSAIGHKIVGKASRRAAAM
jgi:hypothetical protein